MYELFQLVRLLSVRPQCTRSGPVEIKQCAWRENGESCLLALLFSNDHLLLRWSMVGRKHVMRQVSWPPERLVAAMCIDPTASWLLIATQQPTLYIVPALALLDKGSVVNQLWKTDDCTLIPVATTGTLCSACWWHTLDDRQVAIVCTKVGELLFVDLLGRASMSKVTIDIHVKELSLVQDDGQLGTWLLMTGATGGQWRLVLEVRSQAPGFSLDSEISSLDYIDIDARSIPLLTILDSADENKPAFTIEHLAQSQQWITLKPQYARGRHFITAYDQKSATLQVYDSDVQHAPLFVYKLPPGVESLILTDRVMFSLSYHKGCQLMVLSNQKAESGIETQQDFNQEAVLQTLALPAGERVLTLWHRTFPFYWHDKQEQGSEVQTMETEISTIPLTSHTVLDGCVVITDTAVYECRPRKSPERMFLQLAAVTMEMDMAEQLAISVGLDLTLLAELTAGHLLKLGHVSQAVSFYTLSKCQHAKRIASIAQHGYMQEMQLMLKQMLQNTGSEVIGRERKALSDVLLLCYIHAIAYARGNITQVTTNFRDFLLNSFAIDEITALDLLAEYGLISLLLDFAMARGLVMNALESLVTHGQIPVQQLILSLLVAQGFSAHVLKSANGGVLSSLSDHTLVEILASKPGLLLREAARLQQCVPYVDPPHLHHLAMTLDPSQSLVQGLLKQQTFIHQRTTSLASLTSVMSDGSHGALRECRISSVSQALEVFLTSVLHLCHHRGDERDWTEARDIQVDTGNTSHCHETPVRAKKQLALQFGLASCGTCHCAVVRDGDLYTWGSTAHGRLGHGDYVKEGDARSPTCVPLFHMLNICVEAVACGGQHTIAITHHGIYGWGSSRFGQVGVGTRHTYHRPMLLESLLSETCVVVNCGQYHSLALTASGRVYSWGWGVHGQLGHGDPEDQLGPLIIHHLRGEVIVQVSGGYCHTLALSETGQVWVFGCGYFGQLGLGNSWKQNRPVTLTTLKEPVTVIGTKYFHCVAITRSNQVFTWGCHPHNLRYSASAMRRSRQLGQSYHLQEGVEAFQIPTPVDSSYIHSKIVQVSCGSLHTMLLTMEGEVYVWGRNLEGQLGTGSRQDERVPKMLSRINDQHMVYLASGGEFSLALDSDLCVWLWGKNESGQLGLTKLEVRGQMLSKSDSQHSSLVFTSDVIHPMMCQGFPPQKHHYGSLSASINTIRFEDEQGPFCEDHVYRLPRLSDSDPPYSVNAVCQIYKILGEYIDCQHLLLKCVDLKDWATAAQICTVNGRVQQALCYRLVGLTEVAQQISAARLLQLSTEVVCQYLTCYDDQTTEVFLAPSDRIPEDTLVCLQILQYWIQHQLPAFHLQRLLQPYLPRLAAHLAFALFRFQQRDMTTQKFMGQYLASFFCPSFCLKIVHNLLKSSSPTVKYVWSTCTAARNDALSRYGPSPDYQDADISGGSTSVTQEREMEKNLAANELKLQHHFTGVLQAETQLIPYVRLWQDIAHSVHKALPSTGRVLLTTNQLHQLHVPMTGEVSDSWGTDNDGASIVVFTCGHHLQGHAQVQTCISDHIRGQPAVASRCPASTVLLEQLYSQENFLPLSCPKCVLPTLSF